MPAQWQKVKAWYEEILWTSFKINFLKALCYLGRHRFISLGKPSNNLHDSFSIISSISLISLTLYLAKSTAVVSPVGAESCFCVYLILGYFAEVKNKKALKARVFVQTVLYKKTTNQK